MSESKRIRAVEKQTAGRWPLLSSSNLYDLFERNGFGPIDVSKYSVHFQALAAKEEDSHHSWAVLNSPDTRGVHLLSTYSSTPKKILFALPIDGPRSTGRRALWKASRQRAPPQAGPHSILVAKLEFLNTAGITQDVAWCYQTV